ncbi:MAG: hypothetical protein AAGI45_17855 [Cyanobacteria bacterium P01_H01_bin.26]
MQYISNVLGTDTPFTAMTTATRPATVTRADESVIVEGYTWQCAYPVQADGETFWRVSLAGEAYVDSAYFDELDTLNEAIEFIMGGESDEYIYED